MKFRIVKNGFDPAEVEEYIKRLREVYDKTLIAQRDRIFEQRDALDEAEKKIAGYEKDKELINVSIKSAVSKAEDIKSAAKSKYADEIASLREFHEVWVNYFSKIKKKYPLDDGMEEMTAMDEKIRTVLSDAESFVPRGNVSFNPIGMIETHLAASDVAGGKFDYEAAQNPEDDLQNILGDLGIIFDEK